MHNPHWSTGSSANVLERLGPAAPSRGRRDPWHALLLRIQLGNMDTASLRHRLRLIPRQD